MKARVDPVPAEVLRNLEVSLGDARMFGMPLGALVNDVRTA